MNPRTILTVSLYLFTIIYKPNGIVQGEYYVKPTTDDTCDSQPCDTLSGYTKHNNTFPIDSNITMHFLPGIHRISNSFAITRLSILKLYGPTALTTNLSVQLVCTAKAHINFEEIQSLEIDSLRISNCGGPDYRTKQFQVIVINNVQRLAIKNCYFNNNNYSSAITANRIQEVIIDHCAFDSNTALSIGGGALFVSDTREVLIRFSNFTNNYCSEHGGAVRLSNTYKITINSSNFIGNYAYNRHAELSGICSSGGALAIFGFEQESYLNPEQLTTALVDGHVLFENNYAQCEGGGFYIQQSTLNLSGETIFHNNTAHFRGGAMAVREGLEITICTANFTNNSGINIGGAASITNVLYIRLYNCTFIENYVFSGGNILAVGGGGLAVIGIIRGFHRYPGNITTVEFGGFISVLKNYAEGGGGGLYIQSVNLYFNVTNALFNANTAVTAGGALRVVNALEVKIQNSTFNENMCGMGGGAAAAFVLVSNIIMIDIKIINNCVLGFSKAGGALSIDGIVDPWNIISSNKIKTKVIFEGHTVIRNNYANGNGGGLVARDLLMIIKGEIHIQKNNALLGGGGMVLMNTTTSFLGNTYLADNKGSNSGGGIYIGGGTISFHGNITEFKSCSCGYGGGGMFAINSYLHFTGVVIFDNNTANRSGGGISVYGVTLIMRTEEIRFTNNMGSNGGALIAGQQLGKITLNKVDISCTGKILFENNHAKFSGGALFMQFTQLLLSGEMTVRNNYVSNRGGWLYVFEGTVTILEQAIIEANRAGAGGAISGEKATIILQASNLVFKDNVATALGGAISIELSNLHLVNKIYFIKNSAQEGGALHVHALSQINFYARTIVFFTSNYANKGGAINVNDHTYLETCYTGRNDSGVRRCFFENNVLLYKGQQKNGKKSTKQLYFYNNTATIGQELFGGLLDRCMLNSVMTLTTRYLGRDAWYIMSNSTDRTRISSLPVRVCFCVHNSHINCSFELPVLSKIRGELFTITVVVVDQNENPLPSETIRVQFPRGSAGYLGEGEYSQVLPDKCSRVSFHVFSPNDHEQIDIYSDSGPCKEWGISKSSAIVHLLPCPLGFQLSETKAACVCHKPLQQFTNSCDITSQSIKRDGNFWFNYKNGSLMVHPHCPFDYCKPSDEDIYVKIDESDEQCAHSRIGTLCGACSTNTSLSFGSSHCQHCLPNQFTWLTLLFAIAGLLLVAFLTLFRLTVAVGTINGLILYANIIAVNKALLFPLSKNNPLLIFIAWINLDLGIETCYYNGMDMYARTWLQFLFPLYLWALVSLIILVSHYSTYAARLFGRNPISVLATLFLLSYMKLLRTIITIFSVTFIHFPETQKTAQIWLYDGNVNYLEGKHIPLFMTAMLFLIALFLPYTFLLLCGQCLRKLPRKRGLGWTRSMVFTSVMDAYHAPYKTKHRYWTGLMLLVRCILFLTFSFNVLGDPNINLLAITTTVILVNVPVTYLKVYKNDVLSILELSFMINLGILAAITHQLQLSQSNKEITSNISVAIAFLEFVAILIYHCYQQLIDIFRKKIRKKKARAKNENPEQQEPNINATVTDSTDSALDYPKNKPTTTIVELDEQYLEPLLVETDSSNC